MEKYANGDRTIRIERFINAEYEVAVKNFYLAKTALLNWSRDTDAIVYKLCTECSSKLYDAVEHFLREYINNPAKSDTVKTIAGLCEMIKDKEELNDVELSVFITRKEPRNESTHYGRLGDLGDYYRVLNNLYKLIVLVDPNLSITEIERYSETFDFNKFFYDAEEFSAENCHYILMADPLNDINNGILEQFLLLPWSIIVDFDGKNLRGKLHKNLPNISDVQDCILETVKNQGLSETTFKLKKTVYLSMETEVAPRRQSKWSGVDKNNFEYFIQRSKNVEKKRVIIVLAKQLDISSKSFIEKVIDIYGYDNVKLLLLEGFFSDTEMKDLDERYSDYSKYDISSVMISIEEISNRAGLYTTSKKSNFSEGIKIPSYDREIVIEDQALINNMNLYFEVVDLDKGKDDSNLYSEEAFLKGETVTWEALNLKYDVLPVEKNMYSSFIEEIIYSLRTVENKKRVFSVLHKPGYGGTTLSRRIAWDIHKDYPVVILQVYDAVETWNMLTAFYGVVKKGILIVADENNISKSDIDRLQNEVSNSVFPVALLTVRRIRYNFNERKGKAIYLNYITEESCNILEQKCKTMGIKKFGQDKIKKREEALKKIQLKDKCPVLIGLFYLEELFEGTEEYIKRFLGELGDDSDSKRIKDAMCIIGMCDYFGQKKAYSVIIEKILNPTNVQRFSIREGMKKVQELFVFENNNGSVIVKSKHYIISKEIIEQVFVEQGKSSNWKDYIRINSLHLVDLIISVCGTKIDADLQMLIKDMFIENRESEYLKGKFSMLIESCDNEEDKVAILEYLANEFDRYIYNNISIESEKCNEHHLLAHLWGHLGRYYSKKGKMNNPPRAEECCRKALSYSEQTGHYDYIILHIAGDSTAKRMQLIYENMESLDDFKENIKVVQEGITQADYFFEKSILYGNEEYGRVGLLTLWTKFLAKFFILTGVDNAFSLQKISQVCEKNCDMEFTIWIMDGISNTIEKLEYLDIDNYSSTAQTIICNLKVEFVNEFYEKDLSKILQELNNYLSRLLQMPVKDTNKICNAKRLIIRTLLKKNKDDKISVYSGLLKQDKQTKKEYATIMEYLNDNIIQEKRLDADYSLWFKLFRYSDFSIDEALCKAKEWYEYQKEKGLLEPWALYYLYVLNYIRALDGYTHSLEEGEKYRKLCNKVCEEKRKENFLINYSRVRDWLGSGKAVKRLIDDRGLEYSELNKNDNILVLKGRFEEIDPSSRRIYGFLVITEPVYLKGARVFFKPGECGVSKQQIGHIFEFKMGFTFERLVAFDKSIKDLSMIKKEEKPKNIEDITGSDNRTVSISDLVHFRPIKYQKEKGRLSGIIQENQKKAFLHKSEIAYDRFVTDNDMQSYVGDESIEVKVIENNKEFDFYIVSIKQIVLGVNDTNARNVMYSMLKNVKFEQI